MNSNTIIISEFFIHTEVISPISVDNFQLKTSLSNKTLINCMYMVYPMCL